MHRIPIFALAFALLGLLSLNAEERNRQAVKEASVSAKLAGTYTIVKGQRDGKDVPEDHFKGSVVTFTEDKIFGHDKNKKEFFGATYKLDKASKPWKIRMTSTAPKKDEKAEGVVQLVGDTLTICYALPGGKTPTTFSAGEKQHCFTLQRKAKTDR